MEILKIAIEWAKAEVFSSKFFILFAILFIAGSVGFWHLGKTEIAKAYIIPTAVAGALLLVVGTGILYANNKRITSFETDYNTNTTAFIASEIKRTEKSMNEYKLIVFKVIPIIIVAAALLIVFIDKNNWRASCITTIAMMLVILLIDSNANERLKEYHRQLQIDVTQS
ncbi:hypothetical protein [Dokdonia sp. R78006]|uniref:hypothetical protein n=1 Tax=unclassified Dokdonia TaxID=2615033 RepID=UPI0036D221E6